MPGGRHPVGPRLAQSEHDEVGDEPSRLPARGRWLRPETDRRARREHGGEQKRAHHEAGPSSFATLFPMRAKRKSVVRGMRRT
jgi:hypothetical protein